MFLDVPVPTASWETVSVRVGVRPLPVALRRLDDGVRVVAEWPRSGPGTYRVEVHADGERLVRTVVVQPSKLSPDEFEQLLESLETELPASVAVALQNAGALTGVRLALSRPATLAEEVARLRRALTGVGNVPGLVPVLAELAKAPHVALRTTERWVRREHARRPAPARLAHAYARAGNVDIDESGLPRELVDAQVIQSVDTYENRLVATFVRQVDRRLRRLEALTAAVPGTLLAEVRHLRGMLGRARRAAPFLEEVGELAGPPAQVTMVLLRVPAYRAALAGYLAFQRGLAVRLDDPALAAPLAELPHLYQTWGTLQVVLALLEIAGDLGYRVRAERLMGRDADGGFVRVLPAGVSAVELEHDTTGRRVRLVPERTYGVAAGGGLRSATFSQRPDVAVEVMEAGQPTRVYLFDPKYKLADSSLGHAPGSGQPTKADIDKMHAYRDAIRDADGRRVVEYAAILYPGPTVDFGPGIAALSALPSTAVDLRARLRGVLGTALRAPAPT